MEVKNKLPSLYCGCACVPVIVIGIVIEAFVAAPSPAVLSAASPFVVSYAHCQYIVFVVAAAPGANVPVSLLFTSFYPHRILWPLTK